MAARHVDAIAERRLRPIYDWLDNGNNKKALQEAEKVLKKQPTFLCAKVLKGLAFLRLGKEDECELILDAVRAESPSDDSTLQAMTICYREMHKPHRVCEIYEAAAKKEPMNEELITHLFMSYVRVNDYKRQQQTALTLYKLKPKNPYYFWAVMSIVMQAYNANSSIAKSITLPLAERMVQKFVNEGKIEAEQEVQLYIMILEMQNKFAEALDVINSPLGDKLISYIIVPLKRAQLYMKLDNWREANHIFKELLLAEIDQWAYYMEYFTSAFKLCDVNLTKGVGNKPAEVKNESVDVKSPSKESDDKSEVNPYEYKEPYADTTPMMCHSFLTQLQNINRTSVRSVRGPTLAMLELYRRLVERGENAQALFGDVIDAIMGYVLKFGDKPCCVSDLKPFLSLIPKDRTADFVMYIKEYVDLDDGTLPSYLRQMQRHVTSIQLGRCLGVYDQLDAKVKVEHAAMLMAHFEHGFVFNGSVSPTEFGFNDAYALLVSHTLYDVWCETGNAGHLLEAILVLEHALTFSPANFHCKLLKLRFYQLLGAGSAAHRVFEQLDIKHMQLDSMGYYHCNHVYATGQLALAGHLYDQTLKFFTSNYKDSIDHLTFSYKFGSFLKIEEFVEFRDRLNNSFHYAYCSVEKMFLELLLAETHAGTIQLVETMDISPGKDNIRWASLQDNRDLSVIVTWNPPERLLHENGKEASFAVEIDFLRLRSTLLRCLAAAVEINLPQRNASNDAKSVSNGDSSETTKLDILVQVINELKSRLEMFHSKSPPTLPKNIVSLPLPSRLYSYLPQVSSLIVVEMLNIVRCLAEDDDNALAEKVLIASGHASSLVGQTLTRIKDLEKKELNDIHAGRKDMLEYVVNVVEVMSIVTLLCGVCHSILKPVQISLVKKGKKKKDNSGMQERLLKRHESFNRLVNNVKLAAVDLETGLIAWEKMAPAVELPALFDAMALASSDTIVTYKDGRGSLVAYALEQIGDSQAGSLRELKQVVQSKIKYLTSVVV